MSHAISDGSNMTSQKALAVISWNAPSQSLALVDTQPDALESVLIVSPFAETFTDHAFKPGARITRLEGIPHSAERMLSLRGYSLDGLHSLTQPLALLFDLYPALRAVSPQEVPAISPEAFTEALGALKAPLHVVIDMPGHEVALVEMLSRAGRLEMIETLTIRAMQEPCFEGAQDSKALGAMVRNRGFKLAGTDDGDPDWPVLIFTADYTARRISKLQAEVTALREEATSVQATLAERDSAQEELRKKLDIAEKALAESREAAKLVTSERDAAKTAQRQAETTRAELEQKLQQKTERVQELEFRLSRAREDLRRAEGQIDLIKDLLLKAGI